MLKDVFDEAEPRSLAQLWYDRRKRVQWYTFWVAVLVFVLAVFFGLVQSIEGALQVYLAFKGAEGK
jgi:ABC-type Fe3+ transport system permease subunit